MKTLALILALLLTGCASVVTPSKTEKVAVTGQWADVATTAAGLSIDGVAEANPLGLLALGAKAYTYRRINAMPEAEQGPAWDVYGAAGWGAAMNNVCVIVAVSTGGAFSGFCPVVGIASGFLAWRGSWYERECTGSDPLPTCKKWKVRK